MVEGMGSLRGLCPQPEEWAILELCKPFGLLPSRAKPEDWWWLGVYSDKEWLSGMYDLWNRMVEHPGLRISMPYDAIQYMKGLIEEAERVAREEDSRNS